MSYTNQPAKQRKPLTMFVVDFIAAKQQQQQQQAFALIQTWIISMPVKRLKTLIVIYTLQR